MTPDQTMRLMAILRGAYPRWEVSEDGIKTWCAMVGDLGPDEAMLATRAFISDSPHPPTIADIRKRVAAKDGPPAWEEAWGEVMQQISRTGRNHAPVFSSPAVEQAVDAIGWGAICDSLAEMLGTLRAQFRDVYNGYRGRALEAANHGRLEAHVEEKRLGAATAGDVTARLLGGKP